MSHRHIAFDVMRAADGGWLTRASALAFLGMQAVLLFLPALADLHLDTRRQKRPQTSHEPTVTGRLALSVTRRGPRFLLPGFHPGKERYSFLDEFAHDPERFRKVVDTPSAGRHAT